MTGRSALSVLQHLHRLAREQQAGKLSDRECLEHFVRQRDEESFAVLVRRHGPMVRGVCRRVLRQAEDAEDVFQATFLVLARKAGSIRWKRSIAPWLYQVAYRLAHKSRVAAARRREQQATVEPAARTGDESWREVCGVLDEELQALAERYRAPLVLCYLEGQTRDEAAERLGWSLGTLKRRLQKGEELLRLRLTRRGVTLPAVLLPVWLSSNEAEAALSTLGLRSLAQGAMAFASGGTFSGPRLPAICQAEAELRLMSVNTLKLTAALLLTLGLAAAAGAWACRMLVTESPQAQPEASPEASRDGGERQAAKDEPRTDRYGDPLPPGALARLGTVRFRDADGIFSLTFSPDGKRIASGSYRKGLIYIWDTATGKELCRLRANNAQVTTFLAFSRNGKLLVSTSTDTREGLGITIRLWDAVSGKELRQFIGSDKAGYPTALSLDGKRVANAGDGGIRIWDTGNGRQLLQFGEDADSLGAVAFSSDRKVLAGTCKDGSIRLWSGESGKEFRRLTGNHPRRGKKTRVVSLAFSPDDRSLASGASDGSVFLWDVATGKERIRIAAPAHLEIRDATPDGPNIMAFSPDGARLAVGYTGAILDAATGKETGRLEKHPRWLRCLCFSPDGKTLAGDSNNRVRFWDAATGKEVFKDTAHRDPVCSLAFFPDGKTLATTSWDRTVHLWETTTGSELSQFRGRGQPAVESNQTAAAPDGRTVAAWLGDTLYRWDVRRPDPVEEFRDPSGWRCTIAFTSHGRMLTAMSDGKQVRVWQGSMVKKPCLLKPRLLPGEENFACNGFAFSPDSKIVAGAGANGQVHVWDIATGKLIHVLHGFHQSNVPSAVSAIAFSPDGTTLALGSTDGDIALWDPVGGKELHRLKGAVYHGFVNALTFSPDGKTLAGGHDRDGVIRFWEPATAAVRREWHANPGSIRSLAFSQDGRFLASGSSDTTVLIWDALGISLGSGEARNAMRDNLDTLWADLAGGDSAKAYRAIGVLASVPERGVALLTSRLRPIPSPAPDHLTRLIADLDSTQFTVRDKATRELEELGELAEAALRKMLAAKPSLEARRRAEKLLTKLRGPLPAGERLRSLRAVEVLEHAGTEPAQQLLTRLATGAPEARLTHEAKAALQRLRAAGPPR